MTSHEITSFCSDQIFDQLGLFLLSGFPLFLSAPTLILIVTAFFFRIQDLEVAEPGSHGCGANWTLTANSGFTTTRLGLDHPQWTTRFGQLFTTGNYFPAVLPMQLDKDVAASALLPKESMLKREAAPNAAAAVNMWFLLNLLIFSLLGFAIMLDCWPKYDENCLSRA